MLNGSAFREVVSGRRRGPVGGMLRAVLALGEIPYRWAVRRRNQGFDSGRRAVHRVDVPVISVGNLSLGGTGKTPMVAWIARWLRNRDVQVALVSRGYRAGIDGENDEAKELAQQLTDVPHIQNRDRVAGALAAIDRFQSQAIVLDDGFQHRRLGRDLDIVLVDALEPFGFGRVFPRGTLREPLEGLARAHVIVLSRSDLVEPRERFRIKNEVAKYAPHADWIECRHAPRNLQSASGARLELDQLDDVRVAAISGIGNPAAFRATLDQCGAQVVAWREFPDHHRYSAAKLDELDRWIAAQDVDAVVCTQKDLVKIGRETLGGRPLRAVCIELEIVDGAEHLERRLQQIADLAIRRRESPGAAA